MHVRHVLFLELHIQPFGEQVQRFRGQREPAVLQRFLHSGFDFFGEIAAFDELSKFFQINDTRLRVNFASTRVDYAARHQIHRGLAHGFNGVFDRTADRILDPFHIQDGFDINVRQDFI